MSVNAESLRELHRIHRQLGDIREQRATGPKKIAAREAGVACLEAELAKIQEGHTAARVSADQKQLQLKTGESKIVDLRTKLNVCGTNREYQALLEQIAADEMANSVLEDEILEALEKIEEYKMTVAEAEKGVEKGGGELGKTRQTVAEREQTLKAETLRLEGELKHAEADLPPDFKESYDRVVNAKGEDAMARVEEDCCGGCFQQVTPNMENELNMGRVVFCKGCGRLLYLPEDTSAGG